MTADALVHRSDVKQGYLRIDRADLTPNLVQNGKRTYDCANRKTQTLDRQLRLCVRHEVRPGCTDSTIESLHDMRLDYAYDCEELSPLGYFNPVVDPVTHGTLVWPETPRKS